MTLKTRTYSFINWREVSNIHYQIPRENWWGKIHSIDIGCLSLWKLKIHIKLLHNLFQVDIICISMNSRSHEKHHVHCIQPVTEPTFEWKHNMKNVFLNFYPQWLKMINVDKIQETHSSNSDHHRNLQMRNNILLNIKC